MLSLPRLPVPPSRPGFGNLRLRWGDAQLRLGETPCSHGPCPSLPGGRRRRGLGKFHRSTDLLPRSPAARRRDESCEDEVGICRHLHVRPERERRSRMHPEALPSTRHPRTLVVASPGLVYFPPSRLPV